MRAMFEAEGHADRLHHMNLVRQWQDRALAEHGLVVRSRYKAPLHLLEPRRLVADEGYLGAARFVTNVLRDSEALDRVRAMRAAMRANASHLQAYGIVAERVDPAGAGAGA